MPSKTDAQRLMSTALHELSAPGRLKILISAPEGYIKKLDVAVENNDHFNVFLQIYAYYYFTKQAKYKHSFVRVISN